MILFFDILAGMVVMACVHIVISEIILNSDKKTDLSLTMYVDEKGEIHIWEQEKLFS